MLYYDDYDKTHSTNDYLIGINYISKYADDTLLKSAGTLQLKIGTNSNNKDFVLKSEDRLTNILLDYSIERVQKNVSSSGDSSDPSRMILGGHYNHLEIDINGYNFGYDTTFQFDNSYSGDYTIIITSSREGGTMGGASADKYAININDPGTNSSLNLTISNLTIYNFVAPYKPKATITINCTNAIFDATENNWYAFKLYNSTYDVYCISTETTIIYRESGITKLTVNVDNKDNIINGLGRYNGIFIGPENEKT